MELNATEIGCMYFIDPSQPLEWHPRRIMDIFLLFMNRMDNDCTCSGSRLGRYRLLLFQRSISKEAKAMLGARITTNESSNSSLLYPRQGKTCSVNGGRLEGLLATLVVILSVAAIAC
jgi:hypothetical protein